MNVQLTACPFRLSSQKQSNVAVTASAHQRAAIVEISITLWMSSPWYYFPPDTGRPLCRVCIRQEITASVLSGSLQVEAPPSGLCGWRRRLKCEQKPGSDLITSDNGDNSPDDSRLAFQSRVTRGGKEEINQESWRRMLLSYMSAEVFFSIHNHYPAKTLL